MTARAQFAVTCILAVVGSLPAGAAELTVLTNQGAVPETRELAAAFERASGHKVTVVQETGAKQQQLIDNGPADLISANPEEIDKIIKQGKVVSDTNVPFAMASLGVSVRAGAPKPDISTIEAYKAALLAANKIGYSYGCSGTNVAKGIEELGLTEQLKAKTVRTGSGGGGGPVTEHLARGEFDIGIQQTNIMVGVPGTDYVGVPPGFLNKPCQSNVALLTASKAPDAARALIKFMISPEAVPILRKTYVDPPQR